METEITIAIGPETARQIELIGHVVGTPDVLVVKKAIEQFVNATEYMALGYEIVARKPGQREVVLWPPRP